MFFLIFISYLETATFTNNVVRNDVRRFDNITKSLSDRCSYRGLILRNDLKIMLISDPSAITSAAAVVMGVGKFCMYFRIILFWISRVYSISNQFIP